MALLSLDQLEYRAMAKRVNQRLLRLERLEQSGGLHSPVLDLAGFYFQKNSPWLHDKQKKPRTRFPENPSSLSTSDMNYLKVQIASILNSEFSQVSAVKKAQKLFEKAKKEGMLTLDQDKGEKQAAGAGPSGTPKKAKGKAKKPDLMNPQQVNDIKRKTGMEQEVPGLQILDPQKFFKAMSLFHKQKLDKIYNYRDIAKIIGTVQTASLSDIAKAVSDVAKQRRQTRQSMERRFKKLRGKK